MLTAFTHACSLPHMATINETIIDYLAPLALVGALALAAVHYLPVVIKVLSETLTNAAGAK
jgi:hypothetical protein